MEKAQADGSEYAASERAVAVKNVELQDEIYGLKARIAELESHTVTVKLPNQTEFDDPLSAYEAIEKCKDALAAAGIKVNIEGANHDQ